MFHTYQGNLRHGGQEKNVGVSEWICEKIMEMYEETKCRVRVGEKMGESFWTPREMRQGWALSIYTGCK